MGNQLKMSLAAGLCLAAMAGSASAQRALSVEEAALCAGMSHQLDNIFQRKDAAKRRLGNMSINRSSASSVDRYNDAVSVSNALVDLSNDLIAFYNPRCSSVTLDYQNYQRVCKSTNLSNDFGRTKFCKGFDFTSASLDGSVNAAQGGELAREASFSNGAVAASVSYVSGRSDEFIEGEPFPFLLAPQDEVEEAAEPTVPEFEGEAPPERGLNRMPRDRNLHTPD